MIKPILKDISDNWQDLGLKDQPRDLSFLQISSSPGKRFNKGRLIFLIFEKGNSTPILCAKLCRDLSYESSLDQEFEILAALQKNTSTQIIESIPRPLKINTVNGRKVMYESPTTGILVNKILSDTLAIDEAEFKVATTNIFNSLSSWLSELYCSTKTGTVSIDDVFIKESVKPIVDDFVNILKLNEAEQKPYHNYLSDFKKFYGKSLPVVTTHGNLFSCNVMLTGDNQMNIIDWKFSRQTPLILRDIYCFALHTFFDFQRLGVLGSPDILKNFKDIFVDQNPNWFSEVLTKSIDSLYDKLDIDPELHKLLLPLYLMNEVKVQFEFSPLIELGADSIEKDFIDLCLELEVEYEVPEQTPENLSCDMLIEQNKELSNRLQQKEEEIAHLVEAISVKDAHIKNLEEFIFKVRRSLPFRTYSAIKNIIRPPKNN